MRQAINTIKQANNTGKLGKCSGPASCAVSVDGAGNVARRHAGNDPSKLAPIQTKPETLVSMQPETLEPAMSSRPAGRIGGLNESKADRSAAGPPSCIIPNQSFLWIDPMI